MVKTQIQLSDEMYRTAKELAERKEWSLAEVIRRGLEALFCRFPETPPEGATWELPPARPLGGDNYFSNPDWRYELGEARGLVREAPAKARAVKPRRSR
jgi:hypothetical protein